MANRNCLARQAARRNGMHVSAKNRRAAQRWTNELLTRIADDQPKPVTLTWWQRLWQRLTQRLTFRHA
jgi:hypothetical protein